MSIHENSRESHHEHENSGRGATYRKRIFNFLEAASEPKTDRQIFTALHIQDVNNARPEITRLKQTGRIEEVGKIKCPVTHRMVRVSQVRKPYEGLLFA